MNNNGQKILNGEPAIAMMDKNISAYQDDESDKTEDEYDDVIGDDDEDEYYDENYGDYDEIEEYYDARHSLYV